MSNSFDPDQARRFGCKSYQQTTLGDKKLIIIDGTKETSFEYILSAEQMKSFKACHLI